jgi:hypothetical protein
MGIELGLIKMPCLVDCFFAWLGGTQLVDMIGTVPAESHFLPNAVSIAGWSHVFAGLMLRFCKRWHNWPDTLTNIRNLCTWLRNDTHRQHIITMMPDYPNIPNLMKSFTPHVLSGVMKLYTTL